QDSDLVDVSDLPAEDFTTETHIIKRRFLPSKKIEIRVSPYGPVFSDLPFLPQADIDYAMAWVGHSSGSDELTALLETMRATNFTQFRHAMRNFAAPGQNFLYADDKGNIGQIVAAHIPLRDDEYHEKFYLSVADYDNYWRVINDASTLPFAYNPDTHYLASANNRAYAGKPEIGYSYPTGFRYARIAQLVGAQDVWDIASLRGLQDDSYIWSSHSIAQEIVRLFDSQDLNEWDSDYQQQAEIFLSSLRGWDGFYKISSQGAAHYEFFNPAFSAKLMAQAGDSEFFDLIRRTSRRQLLLKEILSNDDQSKNNLPDEVVKSALQAGIDAWAQAIKNVDGKSADNITWGDIHYVQIQHALGNVPIIGRKYRYRQLPIAGGNSSIFKTGFDDKIGASATSYGTQSQHVSDMADLDENYFVLLGGQDGTIGSPNFYDQALLWHKRELIKLPLRDESVREHYKHVMVLR
ncbi:MAG: penicillin acylase family protein, partial [Alphaproteobacteria bacterium]|nr:penicillin acylase family protein [Alphaproteobacteria bacterium]